ncbi:hypothetical protein [Streptococcus suis]|uniref:hypothetical protein n=1 Tax=Streptococcus suis TaxID=1307 RepID=UPI000426935F|nr:hypothetical protein [Streptococcus suis]
MTNLKPKHDIKAEFDKKLKSLKDGHINDFSLEAETIDEATELLKLAKNNGINWYTGELVEPMPEFIYKEMQKYPERIFVLNFLDGFNMRKEMTIFCAWEHRIKPKRYLQTNQQTL